MAIFEDGAAVGMVPWAVAGGDVDGISDTRSVIVCAVDDIVFPGPGSLTMSVIVRGLAELVAECRRCNTMSDTGCEGGSGYDWGMITQLPN